MQASYCLSSSLRPVRAISVRVREVDATASPPRRLPRRSASGRARVLSGAASWSVTACWPGLRALRHPRAGEFIARGTSLSFALSRDTCHTLHVHHTRPDGTHGGDIRRRRTPGAGIHGVQIPGEDIHGVQIPGTHHDETPGGDIHGAQIPDGTHHDRTHPVGHYSPQGACHRRSLYSHERIRSTLSPPL